MKNILKFTLCAFVLSLLMPVAGYAQKKDKEKKPKEKKELAWPGGEMPELTKVEAIDDYLLRCDTLMNELKSFMDSITWYEVKRIKVQAEDDSETEVVAVVDENNTIRGSKEALSQYIDMIGTGTLLALKGTEISLRTATATTSLPQLGLKALSYGKYIKLGPQIAGRCATGIGDILKRCRKQAKDIRAYRKTYTEKGELIDAQVDLSNVDGVNFNELPTITKPSAEYEKEIMAAAAADQATGDINEDNFDLE